MLEPQVIASKKGSKPHTDLDFSLSHKLELSCKSWSQVVPQMAWHVMLRPWWIVTVHWTILGRPALPTTTPRPLSGMAGGFEIISNWFGHILHFFVRGEAPWRSFCKQARRDCSQDPGFFLCWLQIASSHQMALTVVLVNCEIDYYMIFEFTARNCAALSLRKGKTRATWKRCQQVSQSEYHTQKDYKIQVVPSES